MGNSIQDAGDSERRTVGRGADRTRGDLRPAANCRLRPRGLRRRRRRSFDVAVAAAALTVPAKALPQAVIHAAAAAPFGIGPAPASRSPISTSQSMSESPLDSPPVPHPGSRAGPDPRPDCHGGNLNVPGPCLRSVQSSTPAAAGLLRRIRRRRRWCSRRTRSRPRSSFEGHLGCGSGGAGWRRGGVGDCGAASAGAGESEPACVAPLRFAPGQGFGRGEVHPDLRYGVVGLVLDHGRHGAICETHAPVLCNSINLCNFIENS